MFTRAWNFVVDEEGATAVEYAMILALVALATFPIMKWLALRFIIWALTISLEIFWGF